MHINDIFELTGNKRNNKITGVLVYLELTEFLSKVGRLSRENDGTFLFEYYGKYFEKEYAIELGPEFSMSSYQHRSKELFPSFEDRIPLKENAAYPDYCYSSGISVDESNPLVLLSTIGHRGPSSFIFFPEFGETGCLPSDVVRRYRETMGLTQREFSDLFNISYEDLLQIEKGIFRKGKYIVRLIELFLQFPMAAKAGIRQNAEKIDQKRFFRILDYIESGYCFSRSLRTSED